MTCTSRMLRHAIVVGIAAWTVLASSAFAVGATVVTFKIVKQSAGMCPTKPEMRLLSAADQWKPHDGPTWNGENPREIFFTLQTNNPKAELPQVAVSTPASFRCGSLWESKTCSSRIRLTPQPLPWFATPATRCSWLSC